MVASCHISLAGSTGVHVSPVPASGSHFSIALATKVDANEKSASPNCTRVTAASVVAVQDALASKTYRNTVLTVVLAEAVTEPSQRRTRVAAAAAVANGATDA